MHRYADPTRCPNCHTYAGGAQRCPHCGLLLIGPTPQLLLRLLEDADSVLDGLRAEASRWRREYAPTSAASTPAQSYAYAGSPPVAAPGPVRGGRWTAGSTLLALGALCLVVAGFVFVSVSWGALGLLGRTAILAVVTATVGAAAAAVTRRRLRGSAEALWSVFFAMLALDYLGARAYGLLGMAAWPDDVAALVLGAVVAVAATFAGAWGTRGPRIRLTAPEVGASFGLSLILAGLVTLTPVDDFWAALTAVIVTLACGAVLHRAGLRFASSYAAGLAALAQFTAICLAVGEVVAHPGVRALVTHEGGLQVVVAGAMTYALGIGAHAIVSRRASEDAPLIAGVTTAFAVTPMLVLAYAPVMHDAVAAQIVAAVVLVVLAVAGIAARNPWARGIRFTAGVAAMPPLAVSIAWAGTALGAIADAMRPVWSAGVWTRIRPIDTDLGPAWLAIVALGTIAIAVAVTGWYADVPLLVRERTRTRWLAACIAAAGVFATGALLTPPVIVAAVSLVGAGVVGCGVARTPAAEFGGVGVLLAASMIPVASPVAAAAVWGVVTVCAAGIAATMRHRPVRATASGLAVAYLHATVVAVADIAGAGDKVMHLSLVLCVVAAGLAAQFVRPAAARFAAEGVAAAFGGAAIVAGLTQPLGWQSAMLTTLAVACGLIALSRSDRRRVAVVGSVLAGVAYVLRLAASDVGVVEAYTLPFGVILLAAGCLAMRGSSRLRTTTALLPGLTLALLPSLPAVLSDPTTLRGLLLGLAATGVLGAGAWLRWQAPFVLGAALVTVIVARHLGPYADAVPRWSLIALAGTVMLVVGVTWESRVRDARSLAGYVDAMR